jgi:hypothetical protein
MTVPLECLYFHSYLFISIPSWCFWGTGNQTVAELFHTMRRQFTSYEWQTIQQRPSERKQLEIFMRHWVGFLAIIKRRIFCIYLK